MMNAKEELLGILQRSKSTIKCATITKGEQWWEDVSREVYSLKEGYTQEEYEEFLNKLDFDYDDGYGGQELYGMVWLMKDNTWLSRGEYDGSEWWEYNECPKVPDELKA